MISVKNLFYSSYWFNQPYIARGSVALIWLMVFLALILAGIVLLLARYAQREKFVRLVLQKYATGAFGFGLAGLIWFFFRQERVWFLAWRFWLWLWGALFIWWGTSLVIYTVRRLPAIRIEQAERARQAKYLPGKR